jgi:Zn-dependent protease with chaperone function
VTPKFSGSALKSIAQILKVNYLKFDIIMTLTAEQFDALVKRLETLAQQQPQTYKLRVGALAILGYGYIALILVGLLAAVGLLLWFTFASGRVYGGIVQLGIGLLVVIAVVLRSLFVSFPPPEGLYLTPAQAPKLFSLVQELTHKLDALKIDRILLTRDFNASVVQIPRLGILGWHRNYLILGVPLMQALTIGQFRAVLAHEFGHLSGNHSKFSGKIYRARRTWDQIFHRLYYSGNGGATALFNRFFRWYAPFFNAYSFVLGRMNEYEADHCAAELAGAQNMADALVMVNLRARFVEENYWQQVKQQIKDQADPPANAYSNLLSALKTSSYTADDQQTLKLALQRKTDNADTHPCLSDRLRALGIAELAQAQYKIPPSAKVSAAETLLGAYLSQAVTHFNTAWQTEVSTPWRQRYAYLQGIQTQLQALDVKAHQTPLRSYETWQRIRWMIELQPNGDDIKLLKTFLKEYPDHSAANYNLGERLLANNDETGIAYLEKVIPTSPTLFAYGCELIYGFLQAQGRLKEASVYRNRWEKEQPILDLANQERNYVHLSDQFLPHALSTVDIDLIAQQIKPFASVKAAYLVQKQLQHYNQRPFFVVALDCTFKRTPEKPDPVPEEFYDQVISALNFSPLGEQNFIVIVAMPSLIQKIGKVTGATLSAVG